MRPWIAALPLALTLALTACGGSDGDDKDDVASAGGGKGGASGSAAPTLSRDEMGVKFATCLREHGLDVKDPEPGKGLMLTFDRKVDRTVVDKAMQECRQYDPMADGGKGADPKGEEHQREYAVCMRKNGVEAFPDPKPGQKGMIITRDADADPDFKSAQAACRPILQGGGGK
ncbi:hypothetical protein [Actinomadura macrotermitis]|uniref:Secreted protein n=1 Tax=Actinomadura macrotermitis TaxID=2585200 RepID=A0A7K0BWN5_9ACTN|nr:hypothetical protein [Actinomadura macrotermitis]MQY05577.1 hypothetical protein [Actinomadura macrotermitis]